MTEKRINQVLVSLLVSLILFGLKCNRDEMKDINERLDILADRAARAEQAEFYIKDSLDRIQDKLDTGETR